MCGSFHTEGAVFCGDKTLAVEHCFPLRVAFLGPLEDLVDEQNGWFLAPPANICLMHHIR